MRIDVFHHFDTGGATRVFADILARLDALEAQETIMAATVTDIKKLVADIDTETNAVAAKVDAQTAAIQDLKDKLAQGGNVTAADLQAIADGLEPISARLTALGQDAANPIPPV